MSPNLKGTRMVRGVHVRQRVHARVGAVAATVLLALLLAGPAIAQDGGWVIERFDVAITVDGDGSMRVVEEIDVDFGQLQRRGIFRNIPVRYELSGYERAFELPDDLEPHEVVRVLELDRINVTSTAPDDTKVTRPGISGDSDIVIRIGEEDTFVSGRQSYVISYRLDGAMNRFADVDELAWNVTGEGWPVPIQSASAIVAGAPVVQAACFQGRFGSQEPCGEASHSDEQAAFRATDLAPGEGLTVSVGFEQGVIDVGAPILEPKWDLARAFVGHALAVPLTILTALLGFGGVGLLAYRQGRDREVRGGETVDGHIDEADVVRRPLFARRSAPVEYRPPDDLKPGQLGVLFDERVNPVDVSATIVDLAVRGHLQIEEDTRKILLFSRTDWTLRRKDNPDDALLPYERTLLNGLFEGGNEVDLSDLKGSFAPRYAKVEEALYADAVKRKWFASRPDKVRSLWLALGFVATVAFVGLFVAAVIFTTYALAVVPLVLAGLVLAFAHRWMPHRTPKGSALLRRTLGFREFIRTAEAGRMEFAEEENLFERYLPYAVVFGAVDKWAGAFAHLGAAATAGVAVWYVGSDPSRGLTGLSSSLTDFSSQISSSLPTTPASSSSGGGGGGGGGGFGGGGGGSW